MICLCYLFSAKTAWQLVNRKADFFQNESIRIANWNALFTTDENKPASGARDGVDAPRAPICSCTLFSNVDLGPRSDRPTARAGLRRCRLPRPHHATCLAADSVIMETYYYGPIGWLGSRVVNVLDSGAEGPGFKSQSRRCRVTNCRQTVYTHRASVHQAAESVAALLRVARVTAGLAESSGSLTAGFMTHVTRRLTAKDRDQLRNPTLGNRVCATFYYYGRKSVLIGRSIR